MEMSESGHACIADYSNIYLTSTHHFIGVLPKFELRDKTDAQMPAAGDAVRVFAEGVHKVALVKMNADRIGNTRSSRSTVAGGGD
jgi:hypothetical protein